MIANLYLLPESFTGNNSYSKDEIETKIKRLSEDISLIRKYKEDNRLFANYDELYPQICFGDLTVLSILCDPKAARQVFDRDVIISFQNIFNKSEKTTVTLQEFLTILLTWNDRENVHGLIAFHEVKGLSLNLQLIYGADGWFKFRRHFLSLYPEDGTYFIEECKKYYPKLFFHERNKETVANILDKFAICITIHLAYLNDIFYNYRFRHFVNESEKYHAFSTECQLEEDAAAKDVNSSKNNLTWEFLSANGETVKVTCYPHMRLSKSDISGDSHYYFNRIYFHEGRSTIAGGNILIGHIGGHL